MKYFVLSIILGTLCGCSNTYYKSQADAEVYKILKDTEVHVFGKKKGFTISTEYSDRDPSEIKPSMLLAKSQIGGQRSFSIDQALGYGASHSHDYQSQKERLYLSALSLTGVENQYQFQYSSQAGSNFARQSNGERRGSNSVRNGVSKAFLAGGAISLNLANDLLRYFTGDPRRSASSVISINVLQPLLRGAGYKIAAERYRQSHRNVIYAVRDYSHFQDEFSRGIVIQYLGLLQQARAVENEESNYESRKENTEYLRARAVDRASPQEVSDSEQGELQAKNRLINAKAAFQTSLDQFKLTLGMSATTKLKLDPNELTKLEKIELKAFHLNSQKAFALALKHRLPLLNEIDRFEDTKRQVALAADRLKADVRFVGSASLSNTGNNYENFNFNNLSANVGLELNLPVNRRSERNAYRSSLIRFEAGIRTLSRAYDNLKVLIDQRIREVEQFRQNYEIQKGAVELAKKRVEGNRLRLKAGTVIFRRLSESQDALISAQNAVTAALISYQRARLQLYTDMGSLDSTQKSYWLKSDPSKH